MKEKLRGREDKSKCSITRLVAVPEGENRENGGDGNNRQ